MGDLSEHYSKSELECHGENCCGHSCPVRPELVHGLEILRHVMLDIPLYPSCGFRCQTHNAEIKSDPTSQHCLGTAADVPCPEGWTPGTMAVCAEMVPMFKNGGIGTYSWGIHVDVRKGRVRWRG